MIAGCLRGAPRCSQITHAHAHTHPGAFRARPVRQPVAGARRGPVGGRKQPDRQRDAALPRVVGVIPADALDVVDPARRRPPPSRLPASRSPNSTDCLCSVSIVCFQGLHRFSHQGRLVLGPASRLAQGVVLARRDRHHHGGGDEGLHGSPDGGAVGMRVCRSVGVQVLCK